MDKSILTMDIVKNQIAVTAMILGSGIGYLLEGIDWGLVLTAITVVSGAAFQVSLVLKNHAERKKGIYEKEKELDGIIKEFRIKKEALEREVLEKRLELIILENKIKKKKDEEH